MSASQFPPLTAKPSDKRCPNCSAKMALYSLPGHYGATVDIDVCMDCNAIWFDQLESTLLSPDGTVALFQLIHERGGAATDAARKFSEGLRCVTCKEGMRLTQDQVKGTRFSYQACPHRHGRLTTFYNFLAEKQFVRELTKAERAKLAATVQQIRCSGCGAPVNIGKTDACEYCRAPVSVFDREAAKKAIDHYLQERGKQPAYNPNERREASRVESGRWSPYDRADLGADILYALGRAASRGLYHTGRSAPVAGAAGGALAGSVEPMQSAMPDATTALFGESSPAALATAADAASSVSGGALPSAAEALFGPSAGAAEGVAGSLGGEIASAFGEAAGSSVADVAGEAVSSVAGGLAESLADSGVEAAGEIASSVASSVADTAGDGVLDLVSEGIGSLLGSLFS
jgi:hypothetical protein